MEIVGILNTHRARTVIILPSKCRFHGVWAGNQTLEAVSSKKDPRPLSSQRWRLVSRPIGLTFSPNTRRHVGRPPCVLGIPLSPLNWHTDEGHSGHAARQDAAVLCKPPFPRYAPLQKRQNITAADSISRSIVTPFLFLTNKMAHVFI